MSMVSGTAIITEPSNGEIGWIADLMNQSWDYPRMSDFKGTLCNVHTHCDRPIATTLGTSARATSTLYARARLLWSAGLISSILYGKYNIRRSHQLGSWYASFP